ncbi:hypothetical protein HKX48_002951 [Thoreauomyces humboldtii]|nr:hypothetical protein HKX48_002951 [Thoreauomyces humboldtii]
MSKTFQSNDSRPQLLHQLFEKQVQLTPDAIALELFPSLKTVTYRELDARADELARLILSLYPTDKRGKTDEAEQDILIPLSFSKGPEYYVAILAVLKAGAGMVPLDIHSPRARRDAILGQIQPRMILTGGGGGGGGAADDAGEHHLWRHQDVTRVILRVGADLIGKLANASGAGAPPALSDDGSSAGTVTSFRTCPDDEACAYVIYTSGSTGIPKGVVVQHSAAVASIRAHTEIYYHHHHHDDHHHDNNVENHPKVLQMASYAFDVSIADIFCALASGATICVASEADLQDRLEKVLIDMRITNLDTTPSRAALLNPEQFPALELLILGGEPIPKSVIARWTKPRQDAAGGLLKPLRVENLYGPTETTISCFHSSVSHESEGNNIGVVLGSETRFLILDNDMQTVETGYVGELCISGPQLARGYLNDKDKTESAFITLPSGAGTGPGSRLYRTGDLVRQQVDGSLAILGRIDGQIKINGNRVDVGEVENAIMTHPAGPASLVAVEVTSRQEGMTFRRALTAWFVPSHHHDSGGIEVLSSSNEDLRNRVGQDISSMRTHLATVVPRYMIPTVWVPISAMPTMTASGKVDVKRLRTLHAACDAADLERFLDAGHGVVVELQGETQEILAAAWMQVLARSTSISPRSDFFTTLGGDSMKAIHLVSALAKSGYRLTVAEMYTSPMLEDMADKITPIDGGSITAEQSLVEISALLSIIKEDLAYHSIDAADVEDILSATPLQDGTIAVTLQDQSATQYLSQFTYALHGIDPAQMQEAWNETLAALPILRTTFIYPTSDRFSTGLQVVRRRATVACTTQVLDASEAGWSAELDAFLKADARQPFALGGDFCRSVVSTSPRGDATWTLTIHHALFDWWSHAMIMEMLLARLKGDSVQETVPFARYSRHVNILSETDSKSSGFWDLHLDGASASLFPGSPTSTGKLPSQRRILTRTLRTSFATLMDLPGVSPAGFLSICWAFVLSLHSENEADIIFGTVFSGRDASLAGIAQVVGPTIYTLPTRINFQPDTTALDAIRMLAAQRSDFREHWVAGVKRNATSLFRTLVNYVADQPVTKYGTADGPRMTQVAENLEIGFPLALDVMELHPPTDQSPDLEVVLRLEFDAAVIDEKVVETVMTNLMAVCDLVAEHPEVVFKDFPSLVRERWSGLEASFRDETSGEDIETPGLLHDIFAQSVSKYPDAHALEYLEGSTTHHLTYKQLDVRANAVARHLQAACGVHPGMIIPLLMDKSVHFNVAVLAVLKSGAAWAPLDPSHPEARLENILQQVDAKLVLTDNACKELVTRKYRRVIIDELELEEGDAMCIEVPTQFVAYVIFTSGTSGAPKGVMVPHGASYMSTLAHLNNSDITSASRTLQFCAPTFDVWVTDCFVTWAAGATLCLASRNLLLGNLSKVIQDLGITHVELTPTVASLLDPVDVPTLRSLVLGGELVSNNVARKWLQSGCRVQNSFGPTEACVSCLTEEMVLDDLDGRVIGRVFGPGLAGYVLDSELRLLPPGAAGELCVAGPRLAAGYLGRQDLTDKAFVENPHYDPRSPPAYRRMYRTGDLVSVAGDGRLVYNGRIHGDGQLKVNGLRMERASIESAIAAHLSVKNVFVRAYDDPVSGLKTLTAWVSFQTSVEVASSSSADTIVLDGHEVQTILEGIREQTSTSLPANMMPHRWLALNRIPTGSSGKVDERRLATLFDLHREAAPLEDLTALLDEELNPAELVVQQTWAKLFAMDAARIRKSSTFYQMGGNSVQAILFVARCRKQGFAVTVSDVLRKPRLEDIAALLEVSTSEARVDASSCPPPFSLLPEPFSNDRDLVASQLESYGLSLTEFSDVLPATHLQEGMLSLTLESETPSELYCGQHVYSITGELDIDRFVGALNKVVSNSTILRTTFVRPQDERASAHIWQLVRRSHADTFCEVRECDDVGAWTDQYLAQDRARSFGLGEPMMRVGLGKSTTHQKHSLVWTIHHSLIDGWSMQLLFDDLLAAYMEEPLAARPPYASYVRYLQSCDPNASQSFWKNHLDGATPTPYPRHFSGSRKAVSGDNVVTFALDLDVRAFSENHSISIATLFNACVAMVLSQYTGTKDVLLGTVASGRDVPIAHVSAMVGVLIRTLPLRIQLPDEATTSVRELLLALQESYLEAASHGLLSLQDIKRLAPQLQGSEMFGTLTNFRGFSEAAQDVAGCPFTIRSGEVREGTNYPLVIEADVTAEGKLVLSSVFDAKAISEPEVRRLLSHIGTGMQSACVDLDRTLETLVFMDADELTLLTKGLRADNYVNPWSHLLLHQTFERQVVETPEKIAIEMESGETITYRDLNERANRLAHHLRSLGVGREIMVPLCADRSINLIAGIFAILKAGGGVVPIDFLNPLERNLFIVAQVEAKVMITGTEAEKQSFSTLDLQVISMESLEAQLAAYDAKNLDRPELRITDLCYVLYTSGSTGNPKGVVLEHRPIVDAIVGNNLVQHVHSESRVLQFSSTTFDVFLNDLFLALTTGACLCMAPKESLVNDLAGVIRKLRTTFCFFTPSTAKILIPDEVPSMQEIVLGGEPVSQQLIDTWMNRVRLSIVCGPTEAMIAVVARHVVDREVPGANLGKAFGSTSLFVLDDNLKVLPIGAIGELCILTDQLAREYLKMPQKSAETFVKHPFGDERRLYRTGDLVRFTPDLDVEIIGRKDGLIKLRGQRIDVGEIEKVFLESGLVSLVVVDVVLSKDNGGQTLVAWMVPKVVIPDLDSSNRGFEYSPVHVAQVQQLSTDAKRVAARRLAPYMVPGKVFPIRRMPLTSHGKADRKVLKALAEKMSMSAFNTAQESELRPPSTRNQEILHGLWSATLLLERHLIGLDSSFLALGGDSVLSIALVDRVRRAGYHLTVRSIFESPNLEDMAALMEHKEHVVETVAPFSLLPCPPEELRSDLERNGILWNTVKDIYPMAPLQEGLVSSGASQYLGQFAYKIPRTVNLDHWKEAWDAVFAATPILRTTFAFSTHPSISTGLQIELDEPLEFLRMESATTLKQYLAKDKARGVTFGDLFFRCGLIVGVESTTFIISIHHALYDQVSLESLLGDVQAVFAGRKMDVHLPFKNYIAHLQNMDVEKHRTYWSSYLKDVLPTSYPRGIEGRAVTKVLDTSLDLDILRFTEMFPGVLLANLFRLCWGKVLAVHANQDDVVFGSVLSGRDISMIRASEVMGPLIQTVPTRLSFAQSDQSCADALLCLNSTSITQIDHATLGLRRILGCGPSSGNIPMFQSLFNFTSARLGQDGTLHEGVRLEELQSELSLDFPLIFRVSPAKLNTYEISLEYDAARLPAEEASWLVRHFCQAVRSIIADPGVKLNALDVRDAAEQALLREGIRSAQPTQPVAFRLHQLFESQVEATPENVAVIGVGERISYRELNCRANRLARVLVVKGAGPGSVIPICLPKSAVAVQTILAILKTGAAYMPMNPADDFDRVKAMTEKVMAPFILVDSETFEKFSALKNVLQIEDLSIETQCMDDKNLSNKQHTEPHIAYIIATSGSTKEPKGVVVSHVAACHAVAALQTTEAVAGNDVCLSFTSLFFDISVSDIFLTLSQGATLCVVPAPLLLDNLNDVIDRFSISLVRLTSSVVRLLQPSRVPSLKTLIVGGEPVTQELVSTWADRLRLVIRYGTTEIATACVENVLENSQTSGGLIGFPVGNSVVHLLDDNLSPVPLGATGEICISGPQLAEGYFEMPIETAKAFCSALALGIGRLYRTQDMARRTPAGLFIEGRNTSNKLNGGVRFDPGLIESAIRDHVDVIAVHVGVSTQGGQSRQLLTAWLVIAGTAGEGDKQDVQISLEPDVDHAWRIIESLQQSLLGRLPQHLMPTRFLPVDEIPLTPNGKTDTRALVRLAASHQQSLPVATAVSNDPPLSPLEAVLRSAWMQVLGVEEGVLNRRSSWFSFGDSLTAILLVEALRKQGFALTVSQIFGQPLLGNQACLLSRAVLDDEAASLGATPFRLLGLSRAGFQKKFSKDLADHSISLTDVDDALPASPIQDEMVAATRRNNNDYISSYLYEVRGSVDPLAFEEAWKTVKRNTAMMRTTFIYGSHAELVGVRGALQIVRTYDQREHSGLVIMDGFVDPVFISDYQRRDKEQGFRLGRPFIRLALFALEPCVWRLSLTIHHALYDGWSLPLLMDSLVKTYLGENVSFGPSYSLFVEYVRGQDDMEAKDYWKSALEGSCPTLFPRGKDSVPRGAAGTLSQSSPTSITKFAASSGITVATLIKVAWAITLGIHAGSKDVLFGTTISGRDISVPGIANVVGPCISLLPTRVRLDATKTVIEILRMVQRESSESAQQAHLGTSEILRLAPNTGGTPLFRTLLNFMNVASPDAIVADRKDTREVHLERIDGSMDLDFPLDLNAILLDDGTVRFELDYDMSTISAWEISHVMNHLCSALSFIVEAPHALISSVIVTSGAERAALMQGLRADSVSEIVPSGARFLHEFFELSAKRYPDNIAVAFETGERISYSQLDRRAHELAHYLQNFGVGPEVFVPLCITKSINQVVAILAVLKAGGAYVPLDPDLPIERMRLILADLGASLVVTESATVPIFAALGASEVIALDVLDLSRLTTDPLRASERHIGNAAYVIYTSGSTGVPKAVIIEHGAAVSSIEAQKSVYKLNCNTRFLNYSNYSFDAAVADLHLPLAEGGCVCLAQKTSMMTNLGKVVRNVRATAVYLTSTVAGMLDPQDCPSLELLAVGAEPVTQRVIEMWSQRVRLLNIYGPTETSITCIVQEVTEPTISSAIIGKPFGQNVVIILDENNCVTPTGAVGELCIAGPQLARGYLGRETQTAAVFFSAPFNIGPGLDRLYRTGDLVRRIEGDKLEILGRTDGQIKLHGLRIEPAAIESVILSAGQVRSVHIQMITLNEQKTLVAWIVPTGTTAKGFRALPEDHSLLEILPNLQQSVLEKLPRYMLPTRWIPISTIPYNANGKTDKRLLQELFESFTNDDLLRFQGKLINAGRPIGDSGLSPMEELLRTIWAGIFRIEATVIGLGDSFFALGGDSVACIVMTEKCRKAGYELSVNDVFADPILRKVAACLRSISTLEEIIPFSLLPLVGLSKESVMSQCSLELDLDLDSVEDIVPCSPLQEGMVALGMREGDQYMLQQLYDLHGNVDIQRFKEAWEILVAAHSSFRTSFAFVDSPTKGTCGLQLIFKRRTLHWNYLESTDETYEADTAAMVNRDRLTPLTPGGDFWRFYLMRVTSSTQASWTRFMYTSSHALSDAWSTERFYQDFSSAYLTRAVAPRPEYRLYIQYILSRPTGESYWKRALSGVVPTKYPILPRGLEMHAPATSAQYELEVTGPFNAFSRKHGITPATLFRACWALVLAMHADTDDVLFGTVNSGRDIPVDGVTDMIGLLIYTFPIRVQMNWQENVADFLNKIQKDYGAAADAGHLGLSAIAKSAGMASSALFSTYVNFRGFVEETAQSLTGLPFKFESQNLGHKKNYALCVDADFGGKDILEITASYDELIMSSSEVERVIGHLATAITSILRADAEGVVADINVIGEAECKELQRGIVPPGSGLWETDETTCLHELFERQAARTPATIALRFENVEMTYEQLNNRSSTLAIALQALGVEPEVKVPLVMESSIEFIVSVLAILKAGAAYCPISPANPAQRIDEIVQQLGSPLLLTSLDHVERLTKELSGNVKVLTPTELSQISRCKGRSVDILPTVSSRNLAYLILTSGTTGAPKAVQIEHRAATNSILAQLPILCVTEGRSRFLQACNPAFDVSVTEIFAALASGSTLCLASRWDILNDITEVVKTFQITHIACTPTMASLLQIGGVPTLETLMLGGEFCPQPLLDAWTPHVRVLLSYGPTETTIFCTSHLVTPEVKASDLGRPFGTNIAHILDGDRLSPAGAAGEICLAGPQLARGYLRDEVRTNGVFVPHPFLHGQLMYRSGDIGRLTPTGSIEFLRRKDKQIKLRGFRIDLAELENVISVLPIVAQVLVDIVETIPNRPALVAWFVPEPDCKLSDAEATRQIESSIRARLPAYMIPSEIIAMKAFLLTSNGKTDRKAMVHLAQAQENAESRTETNCPTAALADNGITASTSDRASEPHSHLTDEERALAGVWAQVLHTSATITPTTSFFDLGGDSLIAIRMTMVAKQNGFAIRAQDVFKNPLLAHLASFREKSVPSPVHLTTRDSTAPNKPLAAKELPSAEATALRSTERLLTKLWAAVLQQPVEELDPHVSLLSLGADSMTAFKLSVAAQKAGFAISSDDIFRSPTIATLAKSQRFPLQAPKVSTLAAPNPVVAYSSRNQPPISAKPLRVLCLHGAQTSGEIFGLQLASLRKAMGQEVEWIFMDGPVKQRNSAFSAYWDGPYFSWFPQFLTRPKHVEAAVRAVSAKIESCGGVDGIVGFSEGALVVHCMNRLVAMGKVEPEWRFSVLISGSTFKDFPLLPKSVRARAPGPMAVSSVHVTSAGDHGFKQSMELASQYRRSTRWLYKHGNGHAVPKTSETLAQMIRDCARSAPPNAVFGAVVVEEENESAHRQTHDKNAEAARERDANDITTPKPIVTIHVLREAIEKKLTRGKAGRDERQRATDSRRSTDSDTSTGDEDPFAVVPPKRSWWKALLRLKTSKRVATRAS